MRDEKVLLPIIERDKLLGNITTANWEFVRNRLAELRLLYPIAPFSQGLLNQFRVYILHHLVVLAASNPPALLVLNHLITECKVYFKGELTWRAQIKDYGYVTPMEIAIKINNAAIIEC